MVQFAEGGAQGWCVAVQARHTPVPSAAPLRILYGGQHDQNFAAPRIEVHGQCRREGALRPALLCATLLHLLGIATDCQHSWLIQETQERFADRAGRC